MLKSQRLSLILPLPLSIKLKVKSLLASRIMVDPLGSPRRPLLQVARSVYESGGWKGFYRGFVPCTIRAFPVNSCAYFVYEALLRQMGAEAVSANLLHIHLQTCSENKLLLRKRLTNVLYRQEIDSLQPSMNSFRCATNRAFASPFYRIHVLYSARDTRP